MNELFVDSALLQQGNHEAVRRMCVLAAKQLIKCRMGACNGHDDALDFLLTALNAIGAKESPNNAFGWTRSGEGAGTSKGNFAFRNWDIRMTVRDRMREKKEKLTIACSAVSSDEDGEFLLKSPSICLICKGLTKDSELPYPDNVYPMDPDPYLNEEHPNSLFYRT